MTWSDTGNYFAAASRGRGKAGVRLWPVSSRLPAAMPFAADPVAEFRAPGSDENWIPAETVDTETSDEGAFSGFGNTAISPDENDGRECC